MPSLVALGFSSLLFAAGATALIASVAEYQPRSWRHRLPQRPLIAGTVVLSAATVALTLTATLAGLAVAGLALGAAAAAIYQYRAEHGDDGEDDPPGGSGGSGDPPRRPDGGVDWQAFERDVWAYIEDRSGARRR